MKTNDQPANQQRERCGIWTCPMCSWQGLELSKQGTECVCLDFDLTVDLSPATPPADNVSTDERVIERLASQYSEGLMFGNGVLKRMLSYALKALRAELQQRWEKEREEYREGFELQQRGRIKRDEEIATLRATLADRDREVTLLKRQIQDLMS